MSVRSYRSYNFGTINLVKQDIAYTQYGISDDNTIVVYFCVSRKFIFQPPMQGMLSVGITKCMREVYYIFHMINIKYAFGIKPNFNTQWYINLAGGNLASK
jgi:hypothetical protein